MSLPKITWVSGGTNTLQFVAGPQNFTAEWQVRANDNLASNGSARERVVEARDLLLAWDMRHLIVASTTEGWGTFLEWATLGNGFKFYPDAALADYYNCVLEDMGWKPERNAPKKYGSRITIRVLADGQAPAYLHTVLRRLHGLTG